ncbi:MAG: Omp28-related outer membrane protein [Bacteroidetes bacterium]|nr:Omp28-related outer membrane protein [Bacteroidota bacterium]
MKKYTKFYYKLLLTCSIILCSSFGQLSSQWIQSSGPTGGSCRALIQNGGVLYAGTSTGGVMKSTDSARTWVAVNNGLTDVMIYTLVFKGTVLYAGTADGLFSSSNGGNSWSKITAFPALPAYSLATNGTKLFAGTPNGIYVSINNGTSWTNPLSQKVIATLRVIGASVFAGTTYDYLYKSVDTGSTWTRINNNNGLNSNVINSITNVGSTLFLGTGGTGSTGTEAGIYRSVDNGTSWVRITQLPWEVKSIISLGSTLYAGGNWPGLYNSKNNGTTWKYSGLYSTVISSMVSLGSNLFVVIDDSVVIHADTSYLLNYKAAALISPGNSTTNNSKYPLFQWIPNLKAGNMYFQYSTSPTNWSNMNIAFVTTSPNPPTTHTISTPLNYSTKYYWRIIETAWDVVDTSAPLIIVSDTFSFTTGTPRVQKQVLIEYATSVNVGYCPRGETALLAALSKYQGDVLGVSIHNDYANSVDSMRVSTVSDYFSTYILGYPNMTVDRKRFPSVSQAFNILDPFIGGPIIEQLSTTPPVNVQLDNTAFYKKSRILSADVSANFTATTTGDLRLNLYIVEDSVQGSGTGYDQINFFSKTGAAPDSTSPWYNFPSVITNHYHRYVLRSMLGGTWGDAGIIPATAIAGNSYSKNYTFKIPPTWNENRIRLIGIVQKYDSSNLDNREILNVAGATPKNAILAITYPNGGEILAAGDSVTITWDGATPQDTVILELNRGGATWDSVNYFARNGQYRWKVPKIESARCRISVVTTLDSDDSDSTFTISIPKGVASDIDFGLTNVGTSVQKVSNCISTGVALLKVQAVLFEIGTHFFLKGIARKNDSFFITIVFDPQTAGSFTDKAFIITQAGDTILANLKGDAKNVLKPTIIYPNGGEILSAGDTITIQWKGVALQDSVTLAKTTNGGNTWTFFTTKIADSSYKWEVPKVESSQCKIRILTKSESDDSDNDFTISIPQGKASTIDFGNVELQKVEFKDITLTNTGQVPLKITMFRNTQGNPYSTADTAKQTIQPGNSSQVMITYIPTILGITTDTMQWITSAGDIITATMRGNGVSPKPGLNVSFTVSSISMCQFTDTLVTVRVSGGTLPIQYTWSNADGTIIPQTEIIKGGTITDSTIRLLPKNTNTYRVIVTDNQGQKDTATITITVKKHPTPKLLLTSSNIICEGDSTRIEVVNADNYSGTPLWSNTATGASILVKKTGVYYCEVDSNGCVGTSDSITITVNPKPNVSISQQGDELVSTLADSYQWLNSAGLIIAGATSQRYSPPADGKYSVSIILKGCSATSSQFQFTKSGNSSSIVVLLLDFGKQVVSNIIGRNAPLRNAIRVFNNGNFDRVIDSIQITGTVFNLTRTSFPRPIPSSVTISFNADFTPTTIGKFVETVTVFSQGERFIGVIMGEGIELPADGVITEVELVPQQFEVSPGDTLLVFLRIKDEQPTESKATEFIAAMQYDSRVLQWIPRNRQFNDDNSKRTNYWSLNMQNKKRYKGNNQLDTLKFLVKLSDVDSTALIFTDSTAFIWTDANGKVFPACRDSVVYIKVCKEGGKQFVRFANPDMLKTITPNPSTGNSTITLSMGIEGNCIISLVDIFGQTIQEVQYSKLQAGEHTLRFDDSNLETGTYYVLMKTGYSVSSKKISIVK